MAQCPCSTIASVVRKPGLAPELSLAPPREYDCAHDRALGLLQRTAFLGRVVLGCFQRFGSSAAGRAETDAACPD